MTANDKRVRDLIGQEAAAWFVTNRGEVSVAERQGFAAWLRASPVHVEEYLAISLIARDLYAACDDPEMSVESLLARVQSEQQGVRESPAGRWYLGSWIARWRPAVLAAAAVAVVSFAVLGLWAYRPALPSAGPAPETVTTLHFSTVHGEQRKERLADNSILYLNTDSVVTVRYSSRERNVTLESGEVEFEVAHLPQRSFNVSAGAARIADLGTTFNVRLMPDSTVVTVVNGRVAIAPVAGNPEAKPLQLTADQQVSVRANEWPAMIVPVDAQRSTGWLRRQITFEHEPLAKVVTEFNRYSAKTIEITTPALGSLEISGVFSVDDPDAFIAFLRSLEGVHVEVTEKHIRVSQQ
jgi:transmembrane sensor